MRAAAPRVEEGWSYGLPAFRLGGQPVAAVAAHAEHCSYCPMSGKVVTARIAQLGPSSGPGRTRRRRAGR